ncbi:SAM-dependent methyltransferase [Actinoplanes sp. NPDC049316]|uniref:SAM-dependent methyltransferase n=1 Tax=Actinoplanes sp. NPDC049316 TaxID=3154727 RepID=UPI003443FF30
MDEEAIDTSKAHPARRYNYWLGGKDNFAADRESGDAIANIWPHIVIAARANRAFLKRAVTYCVAEAGIRQFLDIGTGMPTADNTHEVAQQLAPESRIVYVDNDPMVLAHARALLTSDPAGATSYIDADLRRPADILTDPALRATLDLTQPVALMLVAVMHFVPETAEPYRLVHTLMDALPAGSHLVLTHASSAMIPRPAAEQLSTASFPGRDDFYDRDPQQIAKFFDGLNLVEPGLQIVSDWRPDPASPNVPPEQVSVYGGVAVKPA